jgi:tRNA(Ile)-lysidine synthase
VSSRDPQPQFLAMLEVGLRRCEFNGDQILVGVSGGADSVALLQGLAHLSKSGAARSRTTTDRFKIIVAHIDHQIRDDSIDDAEWVRSLSAELNIECRIEAANVLKRVAETQESIEEAARKIRYEALLRIAHDEGCGAVAVAHTADDQAETVLHHLVRGTSVTGLRGMLWSRPLNDGLAESGEQLIRPMLEIRRAELEAWLAEIGQSFRSDSTNTDDTLTRNRIRHQLLPTLERDFNPQIRKALGTLAGHAAEVSDLLRSLSDQLVDASLLQLSTDSIRIDCPALAEQPPILIREALLTVWRQAGWPLQRMGHREWQKLCDLVAQNSGAASLPERIDARRRGQLLILSRPSEERSSAAS